MQLLLSSYPLKRSCCVQAHKPTPLNTQSGLYCAQLQGTGSIQQDKPDAHNYGSTTLQALYKATAASNP